MKYVFSARARLAAALFLLAAVGAGCSSVPLYGVPGTPPAAVVAPLPASAADRTFLTQAANRALYEGEVSRLAASRAVSPRVRTFAQWLSTHRAQANSELAALMRAKGVPAPVGLAPHDATKLQRLAALPPSPDFDRGFVRVVGIEDHMASIDLFERARRATADRDVRAWIDRTLPTLRSELSAAKDIIDASAG